MGSHRRNRQRVPQMTSSKTILITGCSSGIGAYCARALKRDGWRVLATARKAGDLAALKADGLEAFYLDYREADSIEALVRDVMAATGGTLDALFNNGGYAQPGAVEDIPMAALREQFETNFFGWHDLTRRVIPVMRKQGYGHIVHCSSILGVVPQKWRGAYSASKHALEGLMVTLRLELKGTNIGVSLIEPGAITSRIAANAADYAEKYIDMEHSVHREAYVKRMQVLRSGGVNPGRKPGPELVYKALYQALASKNPRPHYFVTGTAKVAVLLKKYLTSRILHTLLARLA
jgi:NAD(P)-dependent dehydrogenase (short-subunit alcohol dehydrogenase family)